MTDSKNRPKFEEGTEVDKYRIIKHIGSGGFGDIYTVVDTTASDNKHYAMKVEYLEAEKQGLVDEIAFLEQLQDSSYFPKLLDKGQNDKCRYFVMDLFGPSVSNMRRACEGRHYSNYSMLRLSLEMAKCIEEFHRHGFVHRDIKPANFLIRANRERPVCLIDFGLSKSYINQLTGEHIPFSRDAGFTGTCRYASINAHDSFELSRRDDMLSWFYSVIELAEGRVPWPGSKDREATEQLKRRTRAADLCSGLPEEFIDIYRRLRALDFEEVPQYSHIYFLIQKAIDRLCTPPFLFDWESFTPEQVAHISEIPLDMPPPRTDSMARLDRNNNEVSTPEKPKADNQKNEDLNQPDVAEGGCHACRI
ncbi:CK1 family protein kinase [Trichomonas vaginalis G3]|uniref:non-specific serine/threonine protein kinase n=1 Tax=Trichomonas vaginalis (strain ATCC PRA-98 / G3) TaxID=412133 RepID=A2FF72_TRIV3|nr:peptidyl-serine phosphorylation [Trichomonas vaginalis G3]EAX96439.1 CK1 family protein kinase [Trichomonas vaginalis G3]KAI5482830.1 peptidyl-serine phosphorylation [Trichomonas vaginalis G3]|eukprot:XP_001309369.1 CK1 family protein kinase [Trichomonas vaginalis G3]